MTRLTKALLWPALILLLAPGLASAFGNVEYGSDIHHSEWEQAGSPTECLLKHAISGYGNAWFIHRAGLPLTLEFEVNRRYTREGKATISASPPAWVHNATPSPAEEIGVKSGTRPFIISPAQSLWMLETLQKGWAVKVEHPNWGQQDSRVTISVNPVNFQKPFRDYQACIKQLLPHTFEAVRRHTFYLAGKQSALNPAIQESLDKVAAYLNASADSYRVTIEAHTDNVGRRAANQKLSVKRANSVANYLISKGVASASIKARGYGETRPKANNRSDKGRALNRRVEVRLVAAKK